MRRMFLFPDGQHQRRLYRIIVCAVSIMAGGCSDCGRSLSDRSDRSDRSVEPDRSDEPVFDDQDRAEPDAGLPQSSGELRQLTWSYPRTKVGPISVVIALPAEADASHRMPVLIALHGMGEALKQPAEGARGWLDDYWLPRAVRRLHRPPLTAADLQSFVDEARLARINLALAARPYRGLIVVTPYTPRVISSDRSGRALQEFGDFLVEELLPRVARETPALGTPASTGIDGVSFGGRTALIVGLRHPESFGVVAATQAACLPTEAPGLAGMAARAREVNPGLTLRLLTSQGDGFLRANREISGAFDRAGIAHELLAVPGSHSYEFNRGPGVVEMLIFHDRALRGDEAI
jgi:enterochelin esterase-like enzyme